MEGLPLLPGFVFHDPTIRDFKVKQKLAYQNGFRVFRDTDYGIGGRPMDAISSAHEHGGDVDPIEYDPSLTYGRVREYGYNQVIPNYALFAQKCLNFKAFFRQGVFNSPVEHYRIRHVNLIYFLEDDTMCVMEPPVVNSGFKQGRIVRRGKIEKDRDGHTYHWKDLNVGIDIGIYGVSYHTVDCDLFTREYLRSQGVDVGDKEEAPVDPYTQLLHERDRNKGMPIGKKSGSLADDPRRRFLEYDGMVLCFDAMWHEDDYQIMYFLTDDTIAVREIHKVNDGKDPCALLLKRTKVPKNWKNIPSTYPGIYLECSDSEILEYYTPKDLKIGETIFIFGRRFLLEDCDAFTRKYYSGMLGFTQPAGIRKLRKSSCDAPQQRPPPPPHIAFGTPEDTLAACQSFVPKPPKKDVVRQLFNFPKKLRYLAAMEAVHPEDEDREFIIEYALSDGKIGISEIEKKNSGRRGGSFLFPTLIPKPATGRDDPAYYTPEDFFIGAKVNVFNHRFVITGADLFVYRYVEANPEKFCRDLRDNLRNHIAAKGMLEEEIGKRALKNSADREDVADSTTAPIFSKDDPPSERPEESLRRCQKELSGEANADVAPKPLTESERCRELLARDAANESDRRPCDFTAPPRSAAVAATPSGRKCLAWADQFDKDTASRPAVASRAESPERTKQVALRSSLKNRCKPLDEWSQGDRSISKQANVKPGVVEPRGKIERDPDEIVLLDSCAPCPPAQ